MSEVGLQTFKKLTINKLVLPEGKVALGQELVQAFNNKQAPREVLALVKAGAPVNYPLDYGLSVRLEAEFVLQFYYLLGGDRGNHTLNTNVYKLSPL